MGWIGVLSWDGLESCHGMGWSLAMGSIGVLSWDELESCHGMKWSLVMGWIGLLSWDGSNRTTALIRALVAN